MDGIDEACEACVEDLAQTLAGEAGHEWSDLTALERGHYLREARRRVLVP